MTRLRSKQCQQSVILLITAWVSPVLLFGAEPPSQTDTQYDSRQHFIQLDSEIQAIKEQILEINQEILLLEESSLYPQGQQFVVLVSVAKDSPVNPQSIALHLDGQSVSHHDYTESEGEALRKGGVHRLYARRLREGKHRLDVSVIGNDVKGRAYKQQQSITITKSPGRKFIELHLDPKAVGSAQGLTIREW